jgi:hypothetical protein
VKEKTAEIVKLGEQIDLEKATVILQVYDNSVYLVGGTGGTKSLPVRGMDGAYHITGKLVVADKAGVKDLSGKLVLLIFALSGAKKLFLSPLSRYWLDPCCSNPDHLVNYKAPGYLPKLGTAISSLKDFVRDTLYKMHTSNFCVFCPNKILGIGQWKSEMTVEDASELAALWGPDPVHPAALAYQWIVDSIAHDLANIESQYTNLPKFAAPVPRKPRVDLSLERDAWVRGCTAALMRRDSNRARESSSKRGAPLRDCSGWNRSGTGSHGNHSHRFK